MQEFITQNLWIIYGLILWTLPWKGIALWKAAKNNHLTWFIIIFVINSLAILDIIYIVFFSKVRKIEKTENDSVIPVNGGKII